MLITGKPPEARESREVAVVKIAIIKNKLSLKAEKSLLSNGVKRISSNLILALQLGH
jgi:hypothetical protein